MRQGPTETTNYSRGLKGIIASETAISLVEGDIGTLSYRDY
jgi:citrate synthase